jgi:hypothetical protein
MAVVLNRKTVDEEVMRRVNQVAMDTARGRSLELVRHLYQAGDEGLSSNNLATTTGVSVTKERELLQHMQRIGVVINFRPTGGVKTGLDGLSRYRLTPTMHKLCSAILGARRKPEDTTGGDAGGNNRSPGGDHGYDSNRNHERNGESRS